jgi:hypothetical protein
MYSFNISKYPEYFTVIITPNTIIPLTTMIITITIRSAHIGFEEAGIDDDTVIKNKAYDSNIVIATLLVKTLPIC